MSLHVQALPSLVAVQSTNVVSAGVNVDDTRRIVLGTRAQFGASTTIVVDKVFYKRITLTGTQSVAFNFQTGATDQYGDVVTLSSVRAVGWQVSASPVNTDLATITSLLYSAKTDGLRVGNGSQGLIVDPGNNVVSTGNTTITVAAFGTLVGTLTIDLVVAGSE
jgi:hypothetical protein